MIKDKNVAPDAAIHPSKLLGSGLVGVGRVIYVAPASSESYTYWSGKVPSADLFTDLSLAHAQMVSGRNDVLLLSPDTHTLTAMLNNSKNRAHFIGVDQRGGIGMGARSRISLGITTAVTDIATVQNTGIGNTFQSVKIMNSNTVAQGIYAFAEGGEYTVLERSEFYKETDLDVTGAADVLNNGDSAQWLSCTFGSTANIVADNVIRPNMKLTATLSGKKCRDNVVKDSLFLSKAGGTEFVNIYGANATDVERLFLVENSTFFNNPLSAATPAHAVGFGAAQTEGAVILKNCTSVDHTVMAQAAVGIYVDGAVPTFATTGVAKAS